MKYYLIAGEASGDLHGSNLINAIKQSDNDAVFAGMGGDLMEKAGCCLVQNYRNMAYMGFVAVALNAHKIFKNIQLCKSSIATFLPDHLILIDYPSFNLKIAKNVKKNFPEVSVSYYIPPKVWAWKKWRVHQIAKYSDRILGIFPFEPRFYEQYGYKAEYVGNPTMEVVSRYLEGKEHVERQKRIAIVPGSRKYEVTKCLPIMLKAIENKIEQYEIVVTQAPTLDKELYKSIFLKTLGQKAEKLHLSAATYDVVSSSEIAIVNSGTATLETALLGTPQVAVYYVEFPHVMGALRNILFSIPFFTLVNIIADRQVIKELLAYEFTAQNLGIEIDRLLSDSDYRSEMCKGYEEIKFVLGKNRVAFSAAQIICSL